MKTQLVPILGVLAACGMSLAGFIALPRESVAASYATPLGGRTFGQRHNALLALRAIDGAVIGPGQTFSFNHRVGSYSSDRGFRKAPVSYNGELIDDWGGGVCQASTTLYNVALLAGMEPVERNHHRFCPSYVPPGRDAAVAYPGIDLRLRNPYSFPLRLHAFIDVDKVRVDVIAPQEFSSRYELFSEIEGMERPVTFHVGPKGSSARVRNSGKAGYQVAVYRVSGNRRELVSFDDYPVMNRVIEYR